MIPVILILTYFVFGIVFIVLFDEDLPEINNAVQASFVIATWPLILLSIIYRKLTNKFK
jgi:VanZ family protein